MLYQSGVSRFGSFVGLHRAADIGAVKYLYRDLPIVQIAHERALYEHTASDCDRPNHRAPFVFCLKHNDTRQ